MCGNGSVQVRPAVIVLAIRSVASTLHMLMVNERMGCALQRAGWCGCCAWRDPLPPEWLTVQIGQSSRADTAGGEELPTLTASLRMARKPGAYIYNIMLPMTVLASMGIFTMGIEYTEFADRMSVTLPLLLTTVVYKFIAAEGLPQLGYLTLLDCFMLGAIWVHASRCCPRGTRRYDLFWRSV